MNDLKPFKHGEEGTHYVCQEVLELKGGKATCCGCSGHKCKKPKPMKRIKKECICHYDEKTGCRTDIVCPIHDSPKPSGTKSLKEIHKIVGEIRDEIENPKPTKIKKIKYMHELDAPVNKINELVDAVNNLLSH